MVKPGLWLGIKILFSRDHESWHSIRLAAATFQKDRKRLKAELEKGVPCKWKSKKARVVLLISVKVDFDCNKRLRRIVHNYKGIKLPRDYNIVNIYALNM